MPSVGLVGLPNVGKSTLFNALTAGGQEVSNYPFTTIDPKVGVVPVPDPRLDALSESLKPDETTPSFIRFVDVAGLVEGASRGEGLGNRFLGNLRTVDAVAHVVRCFADPEVVHVAGSVDPVRDAGVIATELLLADLEILTRAVDKRQKEWRTHPREHAAEEKRLTTWKERLEAGERIAAACDLTPEGEAQARALGLLTARPLLYVANVSEGEPENDAVAALRDLAAHEAGDGTPAPVVPVSARIEAELLELPPDERELFKEELGIVRTGFERLVEESFRLLGLIRFYTVVSGKLRAWEVPRGTLAPQAAGKIHGDMEEGFIRARVASWKDLSEHGGYGALQTLGKVSTQGKDYEVRDGDVVEVLFNA